MTRRDNYGTKDRFAGISLPEGVISLDTAESIGLLRPGSRGRPRRHPEEELGCLVMI